MVRLAEFCDIPRLLQLGQLFFNESGMADVLEYDPASAEKTLAALLQMDTTTIFVMEQCGQVLGAVGGIVTPFYFNSAVLCAQEFFWYVQEDFRGTPDSARLLIAFKKWAREKGATVIDLAATRNSPASVASFYERSGYGRQETHYMGRL